MYGKFCISYFVNYSYFEHKACVHVRACIMFLSRIIVFVTFVDGYAVTYIPLIRRFPFLYSTLNHLFREKTNAARFSWSRLLVLLRTFTKGNKAKVWSEQT